MIRPKQIPELLGTMVYHHVTTVLDRLENNRPPPAGCRPARRWVPTWDFHLATWPTGGRVSETQVKNDFMHFGPALVEVGGSIGGESTKRLS